MGGDGVLNHPLDSVNPVRLVNSNQFTYGQQTFSLDSHHFLVDATADEEIVRTCPYLFSHFRDAMEHLSDGTPDDPMVVYIAPYVYWVDDPDDPAIRVGVQYGICQTMPTPSARAWNQYKMPIWDSLKAILPCSTSMVTACK